jgi:hypothetical protein
MLYQIRTDDGYETTITADSIQQSFDSDTIKFLNDDSELVAVVPLNNILWVKKVEEPEPEPKQTICGEHFGQDRDICTRLPDHPHWSEDGIGHSVISIVESSDVQRDDGDGALT